MVHRYQLHMSTPHWAVGYIGLPWLPLGRGVQGFDCYGLFRRVQRLYFGVEVPEIGIDPQVDMRGVLTAFRGHDEFGNWDVVDVPAEGDAVMMGRNDVVKHLGVYLAVDGGGVLHCDSIGGVQFTAIGDMCAPDSAYEIIRYLRHKKHD